MKELYVVFNHNPRNPHHLHLFLGHCSSCPFHGGYGGNVSRSGFGATLSSMLVGAADPALAPFFLGERFQRQQIIATKAACQLATHIPKVLLFAVLGMQTQEGFRYADHSGVLLAMIVAVVLGVVAGKRTKVNQALFRGLFRGVLFVLGLKLLVWDALRTGWS